MKKLTWTADPPRTQPARAAAPVRAKLSGSGALPTREEARRRIRGKPGFFASLTPEARAAMLRYDGLEVLGPPAAR